MKKEKIKQIVLIFLAVFLIGIGYFNYDENYEEEYIEVASRTSTNDITLGDVELVSTNAIVENEENTKNIAYLNEISSSIVDSVEEEKDLNDEYFTRTKMERDSMYSQMLETYQNMLASEDISVDQKSIAGQEITNITKIKNGIMIAENLIKNKGFEDVVILVNNNIASVVVKTKKMENEEIAKIQNIVSRELGIEVGNINISNK